MLIFKLKNSLIKCELKFVTLEGLVGFFTNTNLVKTQTVQQFHTIKLPERIFFLYWFIRLVQEGSIFFFPFLDEFLITDLIMSLFSCVKY